MVLGYIDIISDAEMLDTNMMIEEDYNGHILKVKSKMIVDEDNDDDLAPKVNDVIHGFRYTPFGVDKKAFLTFMKKYLTTIKAHLVEQKKDDEYLKSFQKNSGAFVKFLIKKFKTKSVEIFRNEKDEDVNGALGIGVWVADEDSSMTFFWFKDGLKQVKF